jgi:hypothetical protein
VNYEEYKNEDDLNLIFDFMEKNKNKIRIIRDNKIKSFDNEFKNKNSKIKFILLGKSYAYQSWKIIYNIKEREEREEIEKPEHKNEEENKHENGDKYKSEEENKYEIGEKDEIIDIDEEIKIFGNEFVENNHSKSLIMHKGVIFPLKEYFSRKYIDIEKDNKLKIKLLVFENISNFSHFFYGCESLKEVEFEKNIENNIIEENDITFDDNNNEEYNIDDIQYYNFYGINEYINSISLSSLSDNRSQSNLSLSYKIFKECYLTDLKIIILIN